MMQKKILWIALGLVLLAGAALGILKAYGKKQMEKIPGLSFSDCLQYTLGGEKDAVITVGTIRDGQMAYTVYGADGVELEHRAHVYEIGSLTKTLSASMICQAVSEGRLSLDTTIDEYLNLPEKAHYPTLRELLTHTSGYPEHYFEWEMVGNFLSGRNSFYRIGRDKVLRRLGRANTGQDAHSFCYSNFGYATLGLILEQTYGADYTTLMNERLASLGMVNSRIADGSGDLGRYWDWQAGDAYLAAGGVYSDIEDMLLYAEMVLEGTNGFDRSTEPLATIHASSAQYEAMGIHMDTAGYGWMIDEANGFIWHNGGTGHYNAYLGVNRDAGTAVVILSNLSPGRKIPATVMGIKLLLEISEAAR